MSKTIEERLRTLEDREELIKLKARYVNYNDGGWQGPTHTDADAVADTKTLDSTINRLRNIESVFDAYRVTPGAGA